MKRVDKPIRLYVLTIFIVIAYGLLPFISVFPVDSRTALLIGFRNLPFNGSIVFLYGPNGEASFILIFVSLLLCGFLVGSAIWAFTGDSLGRIATLVFVTADVLWWSGIAVYAILQNEAGNLATFGWATQLVVPPVWLAVVWWNFTRPDLNVYYDFKSRTS